MQPQDNYIATPVTIVISTRNRSTELVKAVKSVLELDYPNFELIVIDQSDNSFTRKAVQPFLSNSRFHYIPTETKGLSVGRNIGIAKASSEFIACTDDDCEVPSNWLTEMMLAFRLNERIGLVFGNVLPGPYDKSAGFIPDYICKKPSLISSVREKNKVRGIGACFGIRRSVWDAVSGFDSQTGAGAYFQSYEDGDITLKVLLNSYLVYQTPNFQVIHYGFRNWQQGRSLAYRNWFGIGAVLTKYLKCGYWSVLRIISYELALIFGTILFNLMKERRIRGVTALVAFFRGIVVGLKTPADCTTHNFLLHPSASDDSPNLTYKENYKEEVSNVADS